MKSSEKEAAMQKLVARRACNNGYVSSIVDNEWDALTQCLVAKDCTSKQTLINKPEILHNSVEQAARHKAANDMCILCQT